jgi:hypothetical protein
MSGDDGVCKMIALSQSAGFSCTRQEQKPELTRTKQGVERGIQRGEQKGDRAQDPQQGQRLGRRTAPTIRTATAMEKELETRHSEIARRSPSNPVDTCLFQSMTDLALNADWRANISCWCRQWWRCKALLGMATRMRVVGAAGAADVDSWKEAVPGAEADGQVVAPGADVAGGQVVPGADAGEQAMPGTDVGGQAVPGGARWCQVVRGRQQHGKKGNRGHHNSIMLMMNQRQVKRSLNRRRHHLLHWVEEMCLT